MKTPYTSDHVLAIFDITQALFPNLVAIVATIVHRTTIRGIAETLSQHQTLYQWPTAEVIADLYCFCSFSPHLVAMATFLCRLLSKMSWLNWLTSKIPFHLVTMFKINPIITILVPKLVAMATSPHISLTKIFRLDWLTSKTPFTSDQLVTIFNINPVTAAFSHKIVVMVTSLCPLHMRLS